MPRKRDVNISSKKSRAIKKTYTYSIKIPTILDHAYKTDKKNKNILCRYKLHKEMHNVEIGFEILYHDHHVPVGWKEVTGHMIFYVEIDFTSNAHWVLDGHSTSEPEGL